MKSIIYLTTATSATASMWRIFNIISDKKRKLVHLGDEVHRGRILDLSTVIVAPENLLVQFNVPTLFNTEHDLNKYKFIINYRDPRDRLCNLFQWKLVHPTSPTEPKEVIKDRAQNLLNIGIDTWILSQIGTKYYDNIFSILDTVKGAEVEVLSYAKLCLHFDSFIEKAAKILNVELTSALLKNLESERIENLENNGKWIGNKWAGSDTLPGRYKRELKPETIEILNKRFEPILRKMAKYDPDYADLYLEGLD